MVTSKLINRTLFFGDNLDILRDRIPDESFDLIYLDPPFNSNRSYNVIFKEGMQDSPAQIQAFDDSWHWTEEAKRTFDSLVTGVDLAVSDLMLAFEKILGHNDILAYLSMMTIRLLELHRVLKPTGSVYLHCDPTASHYLKIVMDEVFGKRNFRNEIIWLYKGRELAHKRYSRKHDTIFFYTKSDKYSFYWKDIAEPLEETSRKALARYKDEKGYFILRYKKGGGFAPLEKEGADTYRQYLPQGVPPRDWYYADYARKSEQLGYPTQKPEALLERIIKASSPEGGWVLDPFCGCGTTPAVAERLKRNWIGIDISTLAVNLVKHRLISQFNLGLKDLNVDGLPRDMNGAKELFHRDPFEYEYWALDKVNAVPAKSKRKGKMRGADKGVDGVIVFYKDKSGDDWLYGRAVVQVKGGAVQRKDIAALRGDIEREKADSGVFISLEKPTKPMFEEAVEAGHFTTPLTGKKEFPKIQLLTVDELLEGKPPVLPAGLIKNYFKEAKASEYESEKDNQKGLDI
ncbi:restriction endonuclease [bacterium]|nr:restriction endonuclease [FCB group bacterium]MBL7190249.1 restriction endonuclease [bacterium]